MTTSKRTKQYLLKKQSRFFYLCAIVVFSALAFVAFAMSLYDGFTNERVVIMLLNVWFSFYTMDLVTTRFKRNGERAFWHNWVVFSKKERKQDIEKPPEDYKEVG